jgi:hypothetical protein
MTISVKLLRDFTGNLMNDQKEFLKNVLGYPLITGSTTVLLSTPSTEKGGKKASIIASFLALYGGNERICFSSSPEVFSVVVSYE